MTEANIGRLRISFLRIQVKRSSNTKKYLNGTKGVTEDDRPPTYLILENTGET